MKPRLFLSLLLLSAAIHCRPQSIDTTNAVITGQSTINLLALSYFTFLYPSVDASGNEVTLSGLAAFPEGETDGKTRMPRNIVIGCHYTITDDAGCPSRFNGSITSFGTDVGLLLLRASGDDDTTDVNLNNLVVMPDYLGYGVTVDSVHPYLCEALTGRNVTDAARYAKALFETLTYDDDGTTRNRSMAGEEWKTTVTGYSQGGAAAMAAQRYIEESGLGEEMHFLGSVCGGGPYSLEITVNEYIRQEKIAMPVVAPLVIGGLVSADSNMADHTVEDYLSDSFLDTGVMRWIAGKRLTTSEIDDSLRIQGFSSDAPADIFRAEVIDFFQGAETTEACEDLLSAMRDNDMTQYWIPQHRVAIFHSTADDVVPAENARAFLDHYYSGEDGVVKTLMSDYGSHSVAGALFLLGSSSYAEKMTRWLFSDNDAWRESGDDYVISTARAAETVKKRAEDIVYDLSGRVCDSSHLPKGIYIRGGRKYVSGGAKTR